MHNIFTRRALLAASSLALLPAPPFTARSRAGEAPIRLGCLTDLNGPYSDLVGKGTVGSIKLAIEDFHRVHPEIPVELLVADFSLKPDVGHLVFCSTGGRRDRKYRAGRCCRDDNRVELA